MPLATRQSRRPWLPPLFFRGAAYHAMTTSIAPAARINGSLLTGGIHREEQGFDDDWHDTRGIKQFPNINKVQFA